jgi:hypothetical protein
MQNHYRLSDVQARICRVAAVVFMLFAVARLGGTLFTVGMGERALNQFHCGASGCQAGVKPERVLPEDQRARVTGSPAAMAMFVENLRKPGTRLGVAVADLLGAASFVALHACAAMALWRLGRVGEGGLTRALPWLRYAALGAMGVAVLAPLAGVLRSSLLVSAIDSQSTFYLDLDVMALLRNLSLALVAYAVTWAVAAGSRAESDLAEIL